jgi:uncharacterized membrane protein YraQ (UPF0718 family)
MNSKAKKTYIFFTIFIAFSAISYMIDYGFGQTVFSNFLIFARDMIFILPPAFILIGLFEVWAKHATIEKHFGKDSGPLRFLWSFLLASTTVGGTFVAFPLANSLYHKGARYSAILSYVTASSLFMIPMSLMEATMLGIPFTFIRLLASVPFIILGAILLEKYFVKIHYILPQI